jgi:predicted dehydrogenase/nucleoside-diphosphate-sugar epimerase
LSVKKSIDVLRVGLLGTGYIADWHARALKAIAGTQLVAACDRDARRVRAFVQKHSIPRLYDSVESMIDDKKSQLDVIHVLVPPDLHASTVQTIIRQGVHVFLEKPMATTERECTELIEEARNRGVTVGVNHNFLFAPIYERLRNDLRTGRLGRPDQLTIVWNRGLNQLRSGPFDLWMFRAPENIMLEIGPHCIAPMLDLVNSLEVTNVTASNSTTLPGGRLFHRRWIIEAGIGSVATTLNLSFAPGFTEHVIHVRGSLASATVDFERNTYLLQQHTYHGMDFDRFRMTRREARSLAAQARRSFIHSTLSKLNLANHGSPYGLTIARALEVFYSGLGGLLDPRLSPNFGRTVVGYCFRIGVTGARSGPSWQPSAPVPTSVALGVRSGTERPILVLGASGFIGQELARQLLATEHQIRLLVRNPGKLPSDLRFSRAEVVLGDLLCPEDLQKATQGARFVCHLARANVTAWEDFIREDVEVTRQVAEACLAAKVERLIYTGTIDSYYAGAKAGVITEETPLDPHIVRRNPYARAKAASEEILKTLYAQEHLPVVILRPGIVIGSGGDPLHWGIGKWSWNSVCQLWGSGRNPLPLVLVADVAKAVVLALATPGIDGDSFNLVAETELSASDYLAALEGHLRISFQKVPTPLWKFYVTDVAKWVIKQLAHHPDQRKPSYRDWETRTQKARYDCTKARRILGWNPVCNRDQIIRLGIQLPATQFLLD